MLSTPRVPDAPTHLEDGWVEHHCETHGFLAATPPGCVVTCRCGVMSNWSEEDKPAKEGHDAKVAGCVRPPSVLPAIIGLFDGSLCRRCDTRFFGLSLDDKDVHREWHEWMDENPRRDEITPELEELFYDVLAVGGLVPAGFKPEGRLVDDLAAPNHKEIERHRTKFMPPKATVQNRVRAEAQRWHVEAVDRVARIFGVAGNDLEKMVLDLRRAGMTSDEISEQTGVSARSVAMILKVA
jgi:hypothetical protein